MKKVTFVLQNVFFVFLVIKVIFLELQFRYAWLCLNKSRVKLFILFLNFHCFSQARKWGRSSEIFDINWTTWWVFYFSNNRTNHCILSSDMLVYDCLFLLALRSGYSWPTASWMKVFGCLEKFRRLKWAFRIF